MATKLFLRDSKGSAIGVFRDLLTTAGAGVAPLGEISTAASGTEIQWKNNGQTEVLEWISGRSPTGGWTLSGTMTFSIWARESNMNANCGARARVFKRTAAGTETEIGGGPYNDGVEFGTGPGEFVWTGTPTSTSFAENDRLIVRFYITNVGTMAGGHTCSIDYGAPDASQGDSFFQINENVTFKAEPAITLDQSAYRIYTDGTESGSSPLAAQDTAASVNVSTSDQVALVRVRVQETEGVAGQATDDYQLRYSHNGGAYSAIDNGAAFAPVWNADSANLTDGEATTNRLGTGSGSFSAGEVSEIGEVVDYAHAASGYTEHLYAITVRKEWVADGDTLDFRIYRNSAAINAYTVTARINVVETASVPGNASGSLATVTLTPPAAAGTGAAEGVGGLTTITITAPLATAGVPGEAAGGLATITVSSPDATASGAAAAAAGLATVTISSPTSLATGAAAAAGSLATVTITSPTATAGSPGEASGSLGTVIVSAPAAGATGAAAAEGLLTTVTITAPTGTAGVIDPGDAEGSLATVTITAATGAATGAAAAAGALVDVTITAPAAGAAGAAAAEGALADTTITPATGAATGAAAATGALDDVTVTAATGVADGAAATEGALADVTVTAPAAGATGAAAASGALAEITVTALTGSATGVAAATGSLATVTITPATGVATAGGAGSASGSIASVTVTAPAAGATGAAAAQGSMALVTVTAPTVELNIDGNAEGSLATVSISTVSVIAVGGAEAAGSLATVTLSSPEAAAVGAAAAAGSIATITVSAPAAIGSGGATATGALPAVNIIAMTGIAGSAAFGPFTITVRDRRGVARVIGPFNVTG